MPISSLGVLSVRRGAAENGKVYLEKLWSFFPGGPAAHIHFWMESLTKKHAWREPEYRSNTLKETNLSFCFHPFNQYEPLCQYHFHFWHQSVCETFSTYRHSFALFTWIIKGHCGIMRSSTCEFNSAKTSGRHQFREESIIMQWNQNSRTSWPVKPNQDISGLVNCIHTRIPFSNLFTLSIKLLNKSTIK